MSSAVTSLALFGALCGAAFHFAQTSEDKVKCPAMDAASFNRTLTVLMSAIGLQYRKDIIEREMLETKNKLDARGAAAPSADEQTKLNSLFDTLDNMREATITEMNELKAEHPDDVGAYGLRVEEDRGFLQGVSPDSACHDVTKVGDLGAPDASKYKQNPSKSEQATSDEDLLEKCKNTDKGTDKTGIKYKITIVDDSRGRPTAPTPPPPPPPAPVAAPPTEAPLPVEVWGEQRNHVLELLALCGVAAHLKSW